MSKKLLLALAACLPLALAGCGGGGGTPASSTAGPGGTQTPAQALAAAKNAVATANSAKTAAAVAAARRALDAAVETASAAVEVTEMDNTAMQSAAANMQDYRTAQTAILDGLQPINASLAAVTPASNHLSAAVRSGALLGGFGNRHTLVCSADPRDGVPDCPTYNARQRYNAAVTAAANAMARATEERTAALIADARRALAAMAQTAQAALEEARRTLEEARRTLEEARDYRTEQTPLIAAIPTQPPSGGSGTTQRVQTRANDLNVTHASMSTQFVGDNTSPEDDVQHRCSSSVRQIRNPVGGGTTAAICEIYIPGIGWSPINAGGHAGLLVGASDLTNGFRSQGSVSDIELVSKEVHTDNLGGTGVSSDQFIFGGLGQYSGFLTMLNLADGEFQSILSQAFGERTTNGAWRGMDVSYRGAFVFSVVDSPGTHGAVYGGYALLNYQTADNTVDVGFTEIEKLITEVVDWRGASTFGFTDVPVASDGTFTKTNDGGGVNKISGAFYGPNAEESAGIFEVGNGLAGSFLTDRRILP